MRLRRIWVIGLLLVGVMWMTDLGVMPALANVFSPGVVVQGEVPTEEPPEDSVNYFCSHPDLVHPVGERLGTSYGVPY